MQVNGGATDAYRGPLKAGWGLLAHPLVRWLIDEERDIKAAIIAYIEGRGPARVPIAGPPTNEEVLKKMKDPKREVELPTIHLTFKKIYHKVSRERGIEVDCSRNDLALIFQWQQQSRLMINGPRN